MEKNMGERVVIMDARRASANPTDIAADAPERPSMPARDGPPDNAITAILAAASHDLRQPLQTLALLNSALARTLPAGSRAAAIVGDQEAAIKTMSELVNALLDIGKLASGEVVPAFREYPIGQLFARLRAEFAAPAVAKGLELIIEDSDVAVRTDPVLLARVLQNLLANAIRYTPRGSVRLHAVSSGGALRVQVSDTGIGIPANELDLIFGEYYRSAGARRGNHEGIGLGLAIARSVAELIGSSIEVDSTVDEGSCFAVTVPLVPCTVLPTAERTQPQSHSTGKGALVVVIDDDSSVADATAMLLTTEGFEVVIAASSAEAITRLEHRRNAVHLVICDYRLGPSENGVAAIEEVRRAIGRLVPAILITGDTSLRFHGPGLDVAACSMLTKPVDCDELLAVSTRLAHPRREGETVS